jgi:2-polyprenyl-3-methyl-5-hydroxy-6-metoxy-1,4-benzoquinol methylase
VKSPSKSTDVEQTLQLPDVHQQWERDYRTPENERFYELVFDYIKRVLNAREKSSFLDVGCGIGAHSIRLARRGFCVLAVDFSDNVLKAAEMNVQGARLDNIKLRRENILALSFSNESFDHVLCWGVLMHIPDIEKALSELERVLKKGGALIISEGNMFSFQALLVRGLKVLLRKEKAAVTRTAAGLEYWTTTSAGKLLTRQANIGWLKEKLRNDGYVIEKHVSGQFTELYTKFSSRSVKSFIHGLNRLYFKYVKIPQFAFGNLLIVRKRGP